MDLTNLEEKKDLKSGNHIIQIYSKDREYFDTLLFFIKQGIERNEKIFCITDSCPFEEILSYLEERAEIDVQDSLDTGQLTFLNFKETYFFNGEFDAERIFVLLQKALEMTFKEGYAGIRVASEMSGILHELPILEKLLEYEAKANFYIQGNACTAICQYDRRRFEPRLLLDLFSLHPVVVLGTKIYDNRYFLSPKDYLARGLHETILDRLIQNLESSEYLEQQLSKEREFGQELLRSLPAYFVAIDADGKTIFANETMLRALGYTVEEVKGKDYLRTFVPPEERTAVAEELRILSTSERPRVSINRILSKDGRVFIVEWHGKRMLARDGSLDFLFGIGVDISERIGMEEAIRERDDMLEAMTASARDAIIVLDEEGKVSYWNRAAEEIFGHTAEEMLGKDLHLTLAPEKYHAFYRKGFPQFKNTGHGPVIGKTLELEGKRKDGTVFPFELSVSAFRRKGQWHAIGIIRDITERKRQEDTLRESEQKHRTIFEATGTAMFIIERDGTISESNQMAERMLGCKREEMIGKAKYLHFVHPGDVWKAREYSSRLRRGEIKYPIQFEIMVQRKDGKSIPTLATINKLPGLEATIVSLIDISKEKEKERHLEENAEQLKNFLAIASHELRHPITLLEGYTTILEKYRHSLDSKNYDYALRAIQDGSKRLIKLVEGLLNISRIESGSYPIKRKAANIRLLVEKAIEEMGARGCERISLDLRGELEMVYVDPEAIIQLFIILLENACNFSPPNTVIEVKGEGQEDKIKFSVLDRGIGVPDKDREKIFELFHQAEDVMHHSKPGLGIGLYVARKIVEAHGGKIWCMDREGGGSAFTFVIPKNPQESEA